MRAELRRFACDCAERVLSIYEDRYAKDGRLRDAIAVARRFADAVASSAELVRKAVDRHAISPLHQTLVCHALDRCKVAQERAGRRPAWRRHLIFDNRGRASAFGWFLGSSIGTSRLQR